MMAMSALYTHLIESNIIFGSETQIHLLWTTNMISLNYKYIYSELQVDLYQTKNQLAKMAKVALWCTLTDTLESNIIYTFNDKYDYSELQTYLLGINTDIFVSI